VTDLFVAVVLGLAGSAHCVAMCGPLTATVRRTLWPRLAVPHPLRADTRQGDTRIQAVLYPLGRVLTYTLLGGAAGSLGGAFSVGGLGRATSIAIGLLLVAAAMPSSRWMRAARPVPRAWRHDLAMLLSRGMTVVRRRQRRYPQTTAFGAGALNGLLPCGLVYAALAASVTLGSGVRGGLFMFVFGLGTVPALAVVWVSAGALPGTRHAFLRILRPAALVLVGLLLIDRGIRPAAVRAGHVGQHTTGSAGDLDR